MNENAVRERGPLRMAARRSPRVLISGAGIAGPALAFWLRRAGFQPTVVERAPGPRPGGQAVDIRGAARTVVARMGLLDQIRRASLDEHGFAYVDDRGRLTARMPATLFGGEGIVADLEILRGDLSAILLGATRAETTYRFSESIASLEQLPDGVHVTFASGAHETFALVVGADGVHSRVRALAFGAEQARAITPLGATMAYFSAPFHIETNGWFLMYNAPGGRLAAVRPAGDGHTAALLAYAARPDPSNLSHAAQPDRSDLSHAARREPSELASTARPDASELSHAARPDLSEMNDASRPDPSGRCRAARPDLSELGCAGRPDPSGLGRAARPSAPDLGDATRPDASERLDSEQAKRRLAERFGDLGWEVPRILAAMWDAPDVYVDNLAQVHLPRWSAGRVVLLGDAGYCPSPLTGLGTSLALVGAYVLAGELARAGGDYARAFSAYEGRLRGYVERAQQLPPGGVGGFLPNSRAALWLRTQSMRLLTAWPGRALLARTFETAASIDLPDEPRLAADAASDRAIPTR